MNPHSSTHAPATQHLTPRPDLSGNQTQLSRSIPAIPPPTAFTPPDGRLSSPQQDAVSPSHRSPANLVTQPHYPKQSTRKNSGRPPRRPPSLPPPPAANASTNHRRNRLTPDRTPIAVPESQSFPPPLPPHRPDSPRAPKMPSAPAPPLHHRPHPGILPNRRHALHRPRLRRRTHHGIQRRAGEITFSRVISPVWLPSSLISSRRMELLPGPSPSPVRFH